MEVFNFLPPSPLKFKQQNVDMVIWEIVKSIPTFSQIHLKICENFCIM